MSSMQQVSNYNSKVGVKSAYTMIECGFKQGLGVNTLKWG